RLYITYQIRRQRVFRHAGDAGTWPEVLGNAGVAGSQVAVAAVAGGVVLVGLLAVYEFDQLLADVIDVFGHGAFGFFAVAFFQRVYDGAVRVRGGAGREAVSFAATEPDLMLDIFDHRNQRLISSSRGDGTVKVHVLFDEFEFFVGVEERLRALDA